MSCMRRVLEYIVHKKEFTETKRRCSTSQQLGRKSDSRLDDKPLINRDSTAVFVSLSVYIGFCLFVLLEKRSGDVFSIL